MFKPETHILVVDDSFNIRELICNTLRQMGFIKLASCDNAIDAFKKLNELSSTPTPIQLILSDLNMPGPSGLDFLKQVRGNAKFKELPFILITTESEKGAVIEAAVSGVSGYIVKPFTVAILTQRLKEAWKKHFPEG